jgi:hypothetical protein
MRPAADPDKLNGVAGADVATVLPLNRLEPAAIDAVTDTSFQAVYEPGLETVLILVKAPVSAPDPKSTENFAVPTSDVLFTKPTTLPPTKVAWPDDGIADAGVSIPNRTVTPGAEIVSAAQPPNAT